MFPIFPGVLLLGKQEPKHSSLFGRQLSFTFKVFKRKASASPYPYQQSKLSASPHNRACKFVPGVWPSTGRKNAAHFYTAIRVIKTWTPAMPAPVGSGVMPPQEVNPYAIFPSVVSADVIVCSEQLFDDASVRGGAARRRDGSLRFVADERAGTASG
jgi:hypothetical protein